MSVNGAEEDGVDNRVEAPSRTPGDGSESESPAEGSEAAAGANGQASSADSATRPESSATRAESSATRPSPVAAPPGAPMGGPSAGPSAPLQGSAAGTKTPSYRPVAGPAGGDGSPVGSAGSGGTSPMAAVSGVASGARGLAAKVGASFSGLAATTKPKGAPKSRPKPKGQDPRRPRPGGSQSRLTARPDQAARPQSGLQPSRSALLSLQRVEPMSVMKFSFLISLVAWVVLFVAVAVIYFTLSKLGVFTKIEQTVGLVTYNKNHPGSNAASWFRASRVLEYTALVCTINAILFTALATVGAALYNLVTSLTGGIEVTLRESD